MGLGVCCIQVTISGVNTITVLPKPGAANVADSFVYKVTDCCSAAASNPAACSYGVPWSLTNPKQACTPQTLVTVSFSIGAPQVTVQLPCERQPLCFT